VSTWRFGETRVDRILEFERPLLAPQVLLPEATPAEIDRHRHWLEPRLLDPASGLLVLAFHSFLVRTPRHTVLVDTCGGNDKPRPGKPRYHMNRWPYLERLAAAGVAPEEVTHVLCTHLHVDHVGWNTRLAGGRWVPTFPNAKYLFARAEWAFWEAHYRTDAFRDDPYYLDSILPVIEAGQALLVEGDHEIDAFVRLEPTPGHTPGHVCVRVRGGGGEAVMSGDLMHHPVQCAEPQWNSCFCVDAAGARRMRRGFLERHAETPTLVMPAHFPTPGAGTIVRHENAFRFAFA
jgi:glyoxylase-like metal-dependent hydrolase (beta-lactamase superfamily II)